MKVELGATFGLSGAAGDTVRTNEGEATDWGIKVGEIHPRLLSRVAHEGERELDEEALDGYSLGGCHCHVRRSRVWETSLEDPSMVTRHGGSSK